MAIFQAMGKNVNLVRSLQDDEAARNFEKSAAAFLSCINNPYDLRPAVSGIMDRIEVASRNLRDGQKLIILMGETHQVSSHRMLQAQLIARLFEKQEHAQSMAVGVELPHNFMNMKMRDMGIKSLPAAIQPYFDRRMEAVRLVSAYVDDNPLIDAPLTKEFLLSMIGVRGLSMRFHDMACDYKSKNKTWTPSFSAGDTATAGFVMDELGIDLKQQDIVFEGPLGMKLRNQFMVKNINRHMSDTDADIYIHLAGSSHLMGDNGEEILYEDSLHKLLKEQGHVVMNVLPIEGGWLGLDCWWNNMLAGNARTQGLPDTIIVTDMLRTRFNNYQAEGERQAIRYILRHSEAHDIALPIHDKKWKRQLAAFRTALPQWVAEAQKAYVHSIRHGGASATSLHI